MRTYVPSMEEFFGWMDEAGYAYAVLRGFTDFAEHYPPRGAKRDIDILVDDKAIAAIRRKYGKCTKLNGVKCDFYNVSGEDGGGYLGFPELPAKLGKEILSTRRLWKKRFTVPAAREHLLSLLYHIAYHKAETSGIHFDDESRSRGSKYEEEFSSLEQELSLHIPRTLQAFHAFLKEQGQGIDYLRLVKYLQNDFMRDRKSYFLAKICEEEQGELNLFVIRKTALQHKKQHELLDVLRSHYTVLAVKDIPLLTRLTKSRFMRGGKWRRGGRPHIAVVVFDPKPIPTDAENQKIHPFVFNGRQFFKRALRERFTEETGANPKSNPLHSTDNEAEAVGHLNLFFDEAEEQAIYTALAKARNTA